jgi:hypothetical protein
MSKNVFEHAVKYNGVYYNAGDTIPAGYGAKTDAEKPEGVQADDNTTSGKAKTGAKSN